MNPAVAAHIHDLRKRLLRALGIVGLAICVVYIWKEPVLAFLLKPLLTGPYAPPQVVFTGVPELFFVYLKVATWGGLFVALPYVFFELWGFMAPGLYPHERRRLWPALVAIPLLFYVGGTFAFWVIVPAALSFFLSFSQPGVVGLPALGEYLKLMFNLCFAVGLAFNLPVVLVLLVQVGVLSVEKLRKGRRLAIVLILVFAAVVTPPDPFSQVIFALPLLALYELAILTAAWLKKQPKSLAKTG